jgi:hypothetical protein
MEAQLSGQIHFQAADYINEVPVSAANPLPVSAMVGGAAASASNPVPVGAAGFTTAVSLTRTADTNAYTANDVLGAATGSTAALSFASMGVAGGNVMITGATLEVDLTAIPSGMTSFDLHLYSVTPPSALGDNAAWDLPSGDRASYLGKISLGSPADLGSTLWSDQTQINKQVKLAAASTSLFAYLVTVGAYTPASATVQVITLHTVGL